ncbi:MAG: hypothetical protein M3068_00780 [Gemmatimonadota bacterium]|nr:hypothetical protein [Gemmatimonadota bacterium]
MTSPSRLWCAALAAALLPAAVRAQDARIEARLDPRARATVTILIDSARSIGLPVDPLVHKALEGASKHADAPRIASAVRTLARELAASRTALGAQSSDAEIEAGAEALHAGARVAMLTQLRVARRHESLSVPLAVLTDLIARGVPADTAAGAVATLARGGAGDDDFVGLRRNVDRDVGAGMPAAVAAAVRARAMPATFPPSAVGDAATSFDSKISSLGASPRDARKPHRP